MKSSYDNFIGVYDSCVSDNFCDNLITYFQWCQKNNRTYKRPDDESVKKDNSANLNPFNIEEIDFTFNHVQGFINEFNDTFWNQCYKEYTDKYSTLKQYDQHTIYSYKVQKTVPTGGYHIWHSEDGSIGFSRRIGVYILYLNDIEEGGETEFLYLSKRIAPRKGRLLVFPANFPWTHRGNPPLSGDKYIMTGWVEFK
jgi:hypothetical protein